MVKFRGRRTIPRWSDTNQNPPSDLLPGEIVTSLPARTVYVGVESGEAIALAEGDGAGGVSQQQLDQAIASETTARNQAIAALTRVPSPPITGLSNPRYLGSYSYYVNGVPTQNPAPSQGGRIRGPKAVVRITLQLVNLGAAVLEPRFGGYCAGPNGEASAWRFIALPPLTITNATRVYETSHVIENIPANFVGGLWWSVVSGGWPSGFHTHIVEIWEGE